VAKWRIHREAVKECLKRQKKSVYWLHMRLSPNMSRSLLYDYLRGETGISVDNMQRINDALGLRFTDE
jgi:hypothetical protein